MLKTFYSNVNYTEVQFDQIEKFASIYLKASDMAIILDIPPERLRWDISQKDSEASRRYYRGKAATPRNAPYSSGLTSAIENTHKNLLEMEDDE